jgi:hypothetical protein
MYINKGGNHMSRIGKLPINIPSGVTVDIKDNVVSVKGPKGELSQYVHPSILVKLEDGRWGGIEIKLGGDDLIEEGASSLITLRNKIVEKSDEKAPSFLLVLTAVGGAYKREDGVFVAPINLLKG